MQCSKQSMQCSVQVCMSCKIGRFSLIFRCVVNTALLSTVAVGHPDDASSQYVHVHYEMKLTSSLYGRYTDVESAYHCYTTCLDHTQFECQGFYFSDFWNTCYVREANYDHPGAVAYNDYQRTDYVIARTSKHSFGIRCCTALAAARSCCVQSCTSTTSTNALCVFLLKRRARDRC